MADKFRVGIIGSGGIFRSLHAPYYETSARAQIVAVADIRGESAREHAERFGATAYTDYRQLLERTDVDGVDVCVHPRPHREICVAAARAGKHVLVEKPMCVNVAEADDMIEAARAAGVRLQVAYMQRWNPAHVRLKELLDDGTLGAMHLVYGVEIGWFAPRHPWLFRRAESGGMMVEQAIHTVDAWYWLFGPVSSVSAAMNTTHVGGTYPPLEEAVENNFAGVLRFREGGIGVLQKSWAAQAGLGGTGVVCANGSARMEAGGLTYRLHGDEQVHTFTPQVPDGAPESWKPHYFGIAAKAASIDHWVKCSQGEEAPTTSGEVGRAGIETIEAMYRSAERNEVIHLPL
jgi:predicted dehydrogenase